MRTPWASLIVASTIFLVGALGITACSSGGSDSSDRSDSIGDDAVVTFLGTLSREIATDGETDIVGGVTICALGDCAVSNSDNGEWNFQDNGDFSGGDVAFDFNGPNIGQQIVVSNLSSDAKSINIRFLIKLDDTLVVDSVVQDEQTVVGVTPISLEDEEPLPSDSQKRACEIIRRSNITITDVKTPVVHQTGDTCPKQIDTLVAVGNVHPIAFEYEVVADSAALTFDPATETATQGQLNRHDAVFSCVPTATFVTNVTARIMRYLPDDGPALTRDEAVSACGENANVGNIEDTVQVTVEMLP